MQTTTKHGLIKPELTDPADITQLNQNWDKIDDELNNIQNKPVTFERETVLQNLIKGSTLSALFGQLDLLNYRYINHSASKNPHGAAPSDIGAAPAYSYSTTDLKPGVDTLETGKLHIVYE